MKIFLIFFVLLHVNIILLAQQEDSVVTKNGVLYYTIQGTGKPILLLSGGPGVSSGHVSEIAATLQNKFQCILFDQRGTGKSWTMPFDSTTINVNQAILDITDLLKKLQVKKITIIGHSWGATLGTLYAIKHPESVERLILIGPGELKNSDFHIIQENLYAKSSISEKEFMKSAEDSMQNGSPSFELIMKYRKQFLRLTTYDAYKVDSIFSFTQKGQLSPRVNQLMNKDLLRINFDIKADVSKLKMPILVLCGRQDPIGLFSTIEIHNLNPRAEIKWIEKSGHFPWLEQTESFYAALLPFLK